VVFSQSLTLSDAKKIAGMKQTGFGFWFFCGFFVFFPQKSQVHVE